MSARISRQVRIAETVFTTEEVVLPQQFVPQRWE